MNIRTGVRTAIVRFRSVQWRSRKTLSILLGALVLAGIVSASIPKTANEPASSGPPSVEVGRVVDLMNGNSGLTISAEIQSESEAKISPEIGGRIIRVRASLGDRVGAGQILAEIENASQRAALLQVEGVLDAAKASLMKVQGGTREEQLAILQTGLASAKGGAVNALLTAYASVDSAINETVDQMFTGVEIGQINFLPITSNQAREVTLENTRAKLSLVLKRQSLSSQRISSASDLKAELSKTESEARDVRSFLDTILAALSDAIISPNVDAEDIAAFKVSATAARAALTGVLSSITATRAALETAEKSLELGVTGAQAEDVAATEASVKQAQGAYNAALANLEKTIIRSPISGTLNHFAIKLGDIVSPTQEVAIVSNNAALEAIAYLTEEDRPRVRVGQEVTFEGGLKGVITKIAPALDPVTRKIEIRIGLSTAAAETLTNGQSLRIDLGGADAPKAIRGPLAIPITALKIEAERNVVYIIQDSKLVAKEVVIGKISGAYVQISSGLEPETEIVVDVRGLKEEEIVTVVSH